MNKGTKESIVGIITFILAIVFWYLINSIPSTDFYKKQEVYKGCVTKVFQVPSVERYYVEVKYDEAKWGNRTKAYLSGSGLINNPIYNDAILGDSIIKERGSLIITLKRGNTVINQYIEKENNGYKIITN